MGLRIMYSISSIADLEAVIDVIPNPVFVKNREHQFVLLNASACELFGHSREILLGRPDHELFPAEEIRTFHEADRGVFDSGLDDEREENVTNAAGEKRTVITRKRAIRLGDESFLVGIVTDVTARREAEARNRYLAFHDALTGLPNRMLLTERIDQALKQAKRGAQRCVLIYIDLDRFKDVNDSLGHQSGDELLRDFAGRLSTIVRASDTVARLGGDEFAILLAGTKRGVAPAEICRRILTAAAKAFELSAGQVFVGASIGIAVAPDHAIGQVELQRRADVALYQAKHEGRGCARIFTDCLDDSIKYRRQIETEMRVAIAAGNQFEVHYQPLHANHGDALNGMEALVRWQHPRLGMLLPDKFIDIAEATGLIVPLGEWVLNQACAMISPWSGISLAVNVSPVQLRAAGFAERVFENIQRFGLQPGRLQLEVTESTILDVESAAAATLKVLRNAGIKIVLDDFGTGYSSLSHLQRLAVDKVKIDRSFVQQLGQAGGSGAIVEAVASLCKKLGIGVTAEGVETTAQRQILRSSGCSELQGYLFSRPMAADAAAKYLGASSNAALAA